MFGQLFDIVGWFVGKALGLLGICSDGRREMTRAEACERYGELKASGCDEEAERLREAIIERWGE